MSSNGAVITGTAIANTLTGSAAVDQIDGGAGADTITGGVGADNLTGGTGVDTFVMATTPALNDVDVITDFTVGASGDRIDISALDTDFNATLKVGTLTDANGTLASLQGTAAAGDIDVLILLDSTSFANIAAAEDEYTATAGDITDSDGLIVTCLLPRQGCI